MRRFLQRVANSVLRFFERFRDNKPVNQIEEILFSSFRERLIL